MKKKCRYCDKEKEISEFSNDSDKCNLCKERKAYSKHYKELAKVDNGDTYEALAETMRRRKIRKAGSYSLR